ncbi:MAG: hypothetical protein FWD26_08960 [Treponema sp.]|nr:hypothetical protein [Treponema sp.]
MNHKRGVILALLLGFLLLPAYSQQQSQYTRWFQSGEQFYRLSRWHEAAVEFRRAQESAHNTNDWAAALYYVILCELAYSDYGSALRDMEQLEKNAQHTAYARDMVYHRARVYYILGFYEDALLLFNRYNASTTDADRVSADRRAAAFFWMGECLYAMSQFDEAEKFYSWVIARYPHSPKIEASVYRLDLIKQKKIEAELLALLQLSHEEALRTSEDYQKTIRTYEHALNDYQRRIIELTNSQQVTDTSTQVIHQDTQPEVIDIIVPNEPEAEETLIIPDNISSNSQNGVLLERARQLGNDVQDILRGGSR